MTLPLLSGESTGDRTAGEGVVRAWVFAIIIISLRDIILYNISSSANAVNLRSAFPLHVTRLFVHRKGEIGPLSRFRANFVNFVFRVNFLVRMTFRGNEV